MNPTTRTAALALACAAFAASAQTVTTPPRTISSQQETQGADSTLTQDTVQPNAQTSTFQMTITGSGSAPVPAPPPAPVPAPIPAPAPAPPPPPLSPLPINGKVFSSMGVGYYVGGFEHGGGQVNVIFSGGSYWVVTYGDSSPSVVASGTWLPADRHASDFTVGIRATIFQLQNEPASPVYPTPPAFAPTLVTWVNTQPAANTALTWRGVGINAPSVSINGAGNIGVMAGGGEFFMARTNKPIGVYISAKITVTITDNRYGGSSSTTFTIAGGE